MRSLPDDARIIAMCVRQIHATDMHAQLRDLGFEVYTDQAFKGEGRRDVREVKRLIISLESLHKLKGLVEPPELLLLDEVRTLCSIFGGGTLKRHEGIDVLERLFSSAKYCLAMDADSSLDNAVKYLLEGLAGRDAIKKWVVPEQKLFRTLRVGFKRDLMPSILEALDKYHGKHPIAIACNRKADAIAYAKKLDELGYSTVLYHGGSSGKTKREHFQDPDAAWEDTDSVIFTSSLSVGVDPRKTVFGKVFYHSFRFGSTHRDMFQGLCRFGRFVGGLIDTTIEVNLGCMSPLERALREKAKKLKPRKPLPTFDDIVEQLKRQHQTKLIHARSCNEFANAVASFRPYVLTIMAENELEKKRNENRHEEEFFKLANHRQWPIRYVNDEGLTISTSRAVGAPIDLDEEQRIARMDKFEKYEYVRDLVITEETEFEFFHDACECRDVAETAKAKAFRDVWFNVRFLDEFPDTIEYEVLRKHVKRFTNHAILRCGNLATLKANTALALRDDREKADPRLFTPPSLRLEVGMELTALLGVPSVLVDGTPLPSKWLALIQDEENGVKHKTHTSEGRDRTALMNCATKLSRGRCKTIKATLRQLLRHFNVELDDKKKRAGGKRNAEGKLVGRKEYTESAALCCKHRKLQDTYIWRCPCGVRVALEDWDEHANEHTNECVETTRRTWDAGYVAHIKAQEIGIEGLYEEMLDGDAILALRDLRREKDGDPLKSAYDEWVSRLTNVKPGTMRHDIAYHRHHGGYGRQWASTTGNLQSCPRVLRPLIAGRYYHDIDIKNCHPTIVYCIAKLRGVSTPVLARYCDNRDGLLVELASYYRCSKNAAKWLILIMLNGGCEADWKYKHKIQHRAGEAFRPTHPFAQSFLEERLVIRNMMLEAHPEARWKLKAYNSRHPEDPKDEWSAFAWALSEMENRIITVIQAFLKRNEWQTDALIFDGLMVRRKDEHPAFPKDMLRGAEAAVRDAIEGFNITLEEKPLVPTPTAKKWLEDALANATYDEP